MRSSLLGDDGLLYSTMRIRIFRALALRPRNVRFGNTEMQYVDSDAQQNRNYRLFSTPLKTSAQRIRRAAHL
jgi:hypothetical protein